MPYIRFDKMPDSLGVGRTARGVTYRHDDLSGWVARVDEVRPGETEITEAEYEAMSAANLAYNEALPVPEAPPPPPRVPTMEERIAALEAKLRAP